MTVGLIMYLGFRGCTRYPFNRKSPEIWNEKTHLNYRNAPRSLELRMMCKQIGGCHRVLLARQDVNENRDIRVCI